MGIRNDVQQDLGPEFDEDLADAVQPFTGSREVSGGYDPVTGTVTNTTETYAGRGVFGGYSVREIDNQHILATDTRLTALQNEITDTPQEGDTIDGLEVVRIEKDPAGATYSLTLRKT